MDEEEDFHIQPTKDKKKSYEIDYDCLEQTAIQDIIRADSDQIISIFGVDVSTVHFVPKSILNPFAGKHSVLATAPHGLEQGTAH